MIYVFDALRAWALTPFRKNSYSTPPEPTNVMVSLAQILMVAEADMAPESDVKPASGSAFVVIKISFEGMLQLIPLTVLTTKRR